MFCVCKVNKYSESEVFVFKHVVFVFASLLCMRIIYIHRNLWGFFIHIGVLVSCLTGEVINFRPGPLVHAVIATEGPR